MDKVFPSEVAHARGHVSAETEAELRQVMLCSGVRPIEGWEWKYLYVIIIGNSLWVEVKQLFVLLTEPSRN